MLGNGDDRRDTPFEEMPLKRSRGKCKDSVWAWNRRNRPVRAWCPGRFAIPRDMNVGYITSQKQQWLLGDGEVMPGPTRHRPDPEPTLSIYPHQVHVGNRFADAGGGYPQVDCDRRSRDRTRESTGDPPVTPVDAIPPDALESTRPTDSPAVPSSAASSRSRKGNRTRKGGVT